MKNTDYFPIILISLVLSGCMTTASNMREVELFPMGDNRYSLYVRGNSLLSHGDVKERWYEEVKTICAGNYTVEEVGIKKVTMGGYSKPAIEGTFVCKSLTE